MRAALLVLVSNVLVVVLTGSGCSTITRPTKPDSPLTAMGAPVMGFRFDGEETVLREPGTPLSPSRTWQREVQNYTATSLNTILQTSEQAPNARTVVSYDMASPSVIQIGTYKEITMTLTTTLPDGTVVKSKPVSGNIDDTLEYALITGAGIGGTVLNAVGTISFLLYLLSGDPAIVIVAVGTLAGGILLSISEGAFQYVVAGNEEKRWSNMYATALKAHAEDVRAAALSPRRPPTPPPPAAANPEGVPPPTPDPSDLPPLLDAKP